MRARGASNQRASVPRQHHFTRTLHVAAAVRGKGRTGRGGRRVRVGFLARGHFSHTPSFSTSIKREGGLFLRITQTRAEGGSAHRSACSASLAMYTRSSREVMVSVVVFLDVGERDAESGTCREAGKAKAGMGRRGCFRFPSPSNHGATFKVCLKIRGWCCRCSR